MRDRVHFSTDQIPIPHDRQLNNLSDREFIVIPFLCPSLNVLASMTKQLDTINAPLITVQSTVTTIPTVTAMENALILINALLPDLSHRVFAALPCSFDCRPAIYSSV